MVEFYLKQICERKHIVTKIFEFTLDKNDTYEGDIVKLLFKPTSLKQLAFLIGHFSHQRGNKIWLELKQVIHQHHAIRMVWLL